MIIETIGSFSQVNSMVLAFVFLFFIIIAYKVFQTLMKAFVVGVVSATFPLVANLLGMGVPLTITNVIWFAMFGVTVFMLYTSITGGAKIMRFAMKPFGLLFRRKPVRTVIINENEKSS